MNPPRTRTCECRRGSPSCRAKTFGRSIATSQLGAVPIAFACSAPQHANSFPNPAERVDVRLDDKNQWTGFPGQSRPSIISTGLSLALCATWKSIRCIPVEIRIDRGQNLGLTARGNIAAMRPMQPRPQGSAFRTSWGERKKKKGRCRPTCVGPGVLVDSNLSSRDSTFSAVSHSRFISSFASLRRIGFDTAWLGCHSVGLCSYLI